MKKKILSIIVMMLLVLIYFLFEPLLTYKIGWNDFDANQHTTPVHKKFNPFYNDAVSEAERIIKNAKDELQAPALSVAVGIDNELVWSETIGYKNLEKAELADRNTSFRIGSTSKAITSVLLGKLMQEGKLQLDLPVQQYVPYVKMKDPVTIRQLASHTSGVRNYALCLCFPVFEYYSNDRHESIKESVDVFQNDPLLFPPGEEYSYSSYNFTLLSAAIEETAKIKFIDYAEAQIFKPSGMSHTSADFADKEIKNRAAFYEVKDGRYKEVYAVDNSNKWAGGGFLSTPGDLVKFGNALLAKQLLRQETMDTLFTAQKLNDGTINEEGYALGWRVSKEKKLFNGREATYIVHHGGTASGSTSFLILFPDHQMVISLLMNRSAPEDFRDFSKYTFEIGEKFITQRNQKRQQ